MSGVLDLLAKEKVLALPPWVSAFLAAGVYDFSSTQERMRLAIELSRENYVRGTGGPFASAVFERKTLRLVSVGVNLVVPQHASLAHGEIVALLLAQESLRTHDLGAAGESGFELVTSAQPCLQCYGALLWSGVRHVVMGARASDVETIVGFDEGPLPKNWDKEWKKRGISLERDVLRKEACAVLRGYKASGAPVYNPERSVSA